MAKRKHLALSDRLTIEQLLTKNTSFKLIGQTLERDCTTISKEVRAHIQFKQVGAYGRAFNNCFNRMDCSLTHLCTDPTCKIKQCKFCSACHNSCADYQKQSCPLLLKAPYVCNGCDKRKSCTLEKAIYGAAYAQKEYELVLSESRQGLQISPVEAQRLDAIISPLLQKGQSLHHIYINHPDEIMSGERSLYNYIDAGVFSARNIDMPRKVRYRSRKTKRAAFKVDKKCRIGRTYADFLSFMQNQPDLPVVQMDSVEGTKGAKVLLTLHFTATKFMLAFLRDSNTSQSVIECIQRLYSTLEPNTFGELFPVILTDNGSEFSNPNALEFDALGNRRTYVFYCDPSSAFQKGAAENNHEFIRRILPKGTSFDNLTQENIQCMMDHINSYGRKDLGNKSPHEVFNLFYGADALSKLSAELIPPDDITLRPLLLKH